MAHNSSGINAADEAGLRRAFQANPNDLGVGLFNPNTGEIRLGSFDLVTQGQGHQGLADAFGILNNSEWRGFIVTSDGKFVPTSHFNLVDGSTTMQPTIANGVEAALRQAGLVT